MNDFWLILCYKLIPGHIELNIQRDKMIGNFYEK